MPNLTSHIDQEQYKLNISQCMPLTMGPTNINFTFHLLSFSFPNNPTNREAKTLLFFFSHHVSGATLASSCTMDDSGGAERRISPSQLRTTTSPSPSPPSPSLEDGWVSKPRMTAAREAPLPLNRLTLLLRINLELLSLDHLSVAAAWSHGRRWRRATDLGRLLSLSVTSLAGSRSTSSCSFSPPSW